MCMKCIQYKLALVLLSARSSKTIIGLLTLNLPSSHTKEADAIDLFSVPSIMRTYVCFSPSEVNDKTLGFTEILSPLGAVTIAL